MSVNSKMKAIADAIRAHTGGTDALTLDAMAEAIAGIQAGGGNIFGRSFETGTFVAAETNTSVSVNHSLGVIPTGGIFWTEADAYADTTQTYALMGIAIFFDDTNWYGARALISKQNATTTNAVAASGKYSTATGNTSMTGAPSTSAFSGATVYGMASETKVSFYCAQKFPAGVEYKYILFGGLPK